MGIKIVLFLHVCLSVCQLASSPFADLYYQYKDFILKKNIWQVIHFHARTFIHLYFIILEVLNILLLNSLKYFFYVLDSHNTKFKELSKKTFSYLKLTSFFFLHSAWHLDTGCHYRDGPELHPFAFRVHAHSIGKTFQYSVFTEI